MQLYANPNNDDHRRNNEEFRAFMRRFEWAKFFHPNEEKAPWHVQCVLTTDNGYHLTLNFWPHKLKGQYVGYDGHGATYQGADGLQSMMAKAINDCRDKDEIFEVIED